MNPYEAPQSEEPAPPTPNQRPGLKIKGSVLLVLILTGLALFVVALSFTIRAA